MEILSATRNVSPNPLRAIYEGEIWLIFTSGDGRFDIDQSGAFVYVVEAIAIARLQRVRVSLAEPAA